MCFFVCRKSSPYLGVFKLQFVFLWIVKLVFYVVLNTFFKLKQFNYLINFIVIFPLQAEFTREKHKSCSGSDSEENPFAPR